ncbi:hypothetical protein [Arthrobacter sp. MMS18-M83]|uniref:hypothetical protein n=1 Tax=Arthrobacter sp. MMS18-M83 TaxID=2996261 RepID=UPI00227D2918|nr:hypothetical protein [Arthrobacter sp. MMS18-M83]WAH99268.1 hypothetical protein OW521_10865 [Arthrobacter sp. MMS18-M83]
MAGTSPQHVSLRDSVAAPKVFAALSVLTVLLCSLSTASPVVAATPCWDISGTWATVQGGSRTLAFNFQQNGNQVSGTAGDASLSGNFTGNVTGDHVDVIVVWNAKRANGSTLEGEYEATISPGTLTGTTHDVANASSHATWTATGGPTKTCAGATATPTSTPTSTTLTKDAAEREILDALSNATVGGALGDLSTDGGKAMQAAFNKLFPKLNADASRLVYHAGVLASQDGSDGKPTFPGVRACMPIILRMAYNAVTDPDPAARASALLAARRLMVFLAARDFRVTKGAPS